MRSLKIVDLHEGLVLGEDIVCKNVRLANRGTIITSELVYFLCNNTDVSKSVKVLGLKELRPLILKGDILFRAYVNYISLCISRLMYSSFLDITRIPFIVKLAQGYLLKNRLVVYSLIKLCYHHSYTMIHSINVATYSLAVGLILGLRYNDLYNVFIGGILHDLGKLSINTNILDKRCSLSEAEFITIKSHSYCGFELLDSISNLNGSVKMIILQHHEKLDGSGYPNNLRGYEILNLSKIVTACDIFDALTSDRSYHKGISNIKALNILYEGVANGKLDCIVVNALSNIIKISRSASLKKGR